MFVSPRGNIAAARTFFTAALASHGAPDEIVSDLAQPLEHVRIVAAQRTGWGQVYMATYKDSAGDWLDGAHTYQLRVPKDAPVEAFWSITLYDVATRRILRNDQEIVDRSSRMDLLEDPDGGVAIDIGPEAPAGREQNWIPTVPGRTFDIRATLTSDIVSASTRPLT